MNRTLTSNYLSTWSVLVRHWAYLFASVRPMRGHDNRLLRVDWLAKSWYTARSFTTWPLRMFVFTYCCRVPSVTTNQIKLIYTIKVYPSNYSAKPLLCELLMCYFTQRFIRSGPVDNTVCIYEVPWNTGQESGLGKQGKD